MKWYENMYLSANLSPYEQQRVAKGWLRNPVRIAIGKTGISSEHVQQHVLVLPNYSTKVRVSNMIISFLFISREK